MTVVFDSGLGGLMVLFFFFNDTATTEIYTLSLHDALPIYEQHGPHHDPDRSHRAIVYQLFVDRKSTRLNSSHSSISYAVFCLKKKISPSSTSASSPCRPRPSSISATATTSPT